MVEKCYFCGRTAEECNQIFIDFVESNYELLSEDMFIEDEFISCEKNRAETIIGIKQYKEKLDEYINNTAPIAKLSPEFVEKYRVWDKDKYSVAKEIGYPFADGEIEILDSVLCLLGNDKTLGEVYDMVKGRIKAADAEIKQAESSIVDKESKEEFIKRSIDAKYLTGSLEHIKVDTVKVPIGFNKAEESRLNSQILRDWEEYKKSRKTTNQLKRYMEDYPLLLTKSIDITVPCCSICKKMFDNAAEAARVCLAERDEDW